MGKTIQYTIITNKEYSFPNCINKLPASLMNKRTTKLFTKSENAKIQKRVAKTKILVK